MTPEERLYILNLEDAIERSRNSIRFLHDCLTDPARKSYAYPAMTLRELEKLNELVPPRQEWCAHSSIRRGKEENCQACKNHWDRVHKRALLEAEVSAILQRSNEMGECDG